MKRICWFLLLLIQVEVAFAQEMLNLAWEWQFKLDPQNKGIVQQWFNKSSFADIIRLPGCLQEQGYGNVPDINTEWWGGETSEKWFDERPWLAKYRDSADFETQQFLLPDRHYLGAAWYAIDFDISITWKEKDVSLFLERAHWETQLWVDGKDFGRNRSLGTPHEYNLGVIEPGSHRVVLRVDNSELVKLGGKPHSVSEETAGTWNGIVGKLQLRADPPVHLERVQLYPDIANKTVRVEGEIARRNTNQNGTWKLKVDVSGVGKNKHHPTSATFNGKLMGNKTYAIKFNFPMGAETKFWDEFDPNLYEMTLSLDVATGDQNFKSRVKRRFGMREMGIEGTQFTINGNKTFLRGNVDCAVYPKTGYAPMDIYSWKRVWQTYKDFGLNMARFHSWCPPEAAFIAADEVGIYLAPEVGEWVWVAKEDQFDFIEKESSQILKEFGNHPSFIQLGEGNEAGGKKEFFRDLIKKWKAHDPRHLYTIKANSEGNPLNIDYEVVRGAGKLFQRIRYQSGWPPTPMNSEFQSQSPGTEKNWEVGVTKSTKPLIAHETAQITAYPNIFTEISKYTGYLNPSYLHIAEDQLRERGMLGQLTDFVEASGKWQVQLTKEEFEADYRTKNLAGFHWLCLEDFTGQDTAPVGFTDAFYDPKPYIDPREVREWNGPTVLLAAFDKRVYTSLNNFKADILVSHFGKENEWLKLTATLKNDRGDIVQSWELPEKEVAQGNAQMIGSIFGRSTKIDLPTHLTLEVNAGEKQLSNYWDLWIFPKITAEKAPKSIIIAEKWDKTIENRLKQGKTVLLLPKQEDLKGHLPICFTNYYWTSFGANAGQSSAAGMLIDDGHPVFKDFATEDHTNWQWWDMLTYAHPMIIDAQDTGNPWPKSFRAIIQPIDTWKINRKLGLLVETKVGRGKLMICSIDLETDLDKRPVTRQFRHNLFEYMQSGDFKPKVEIDVNAIKELFSNEEARD